MLLQVFATVNGKRNRFYLIWGLIHLLFGKALFWFLGCFGEFLCVLYLVVIRVVFCVFIIVCTNPTVSLYLLIDTSFVLFFVWD